MRLFFIALVIVCCGCGQRTTSSSSSTAASTAGTKPQEMQSVEDVVGTYKLGSNLGVWCTLELIDDSTFSFSYSGALGKHGGDEGTFERSGETVVLNPETPFNYGGFLRQATVLYPVKWADRLYLIGDHQILRFCDRVRQGWAGNQYGGSGDFYYLRVKGEPTEEEILSRAQSTPEVPEVYEKYLEEQFTCLVLEHISDRTVLIDKGTADGVALETKLNAPGAGRLFVTAVREHESECEVWRYDTVVPTVGTAYSPVD